MSQPTFPEGPPVPLMTEGVVDGATIRQLAADLESAARVQMVRVKAAPGAYAGAETPTLAQAVEWLLGGATRAAQVSYHYDGQNWTDTIMAVPDGFRMVRCRHEA